MMHVRLLELLRRLTPKELADFDAFLISPFFNRSEKALLLFRHLVQYAPDFAPSQLDGGQAFAAVWGGDKSFDKAALNRLSSQLFKLAEQYLAHAALSSDPIRARLYLMRRYERMELEPHLLATHNRLDELWQQPGSMLDQMAGRLEAELIIADWLHRSDDRTGASNLQKLNDSLDQFFMAYKLRFLNAMLSRGAVSKTDYRLSWKEALLEALEQSPKWRSDPAVELQYRIMHVLLHPGDAGLYAALHEFTRASREVLFVTDLRDAYACLQNAAKLVYALQDYYARLFELYQEQLDAGILYENGQLHHGVFRNVVNTALNVHQREWAARFIASHKERIMPEAYRDAAYLQNMALWHFHGGDFHKAQDCLLRSNPKDVYYKLADRSLLARIYFELRESEVLDNFLNTFAKFVFDQQKKIAASKVQSYRAFINALRQLHNLIHAMPDMYEDWSKRRPVRSAESRTQLSKLTGQISAAPVFYGQKWLLEKTAEMLAQS